MISADALRCWGLSERGRGCNFNTLAIVHVQEPGLGQAVDHDTDEDDSCPGDWSPERFKEELTRPFGHA
jgi:hypothetical protein